MGAHTLQSLQSPVPHLLQGAPRDHLLTLSDSPALSRFHPAARAIERSNGLPALLREKTPPADTVSRDPAGKVEDQFNSLVYSSHVAKFSLVAQFQEAAARIAQSQDGNDVQVAEFTAEQLDFAFFAEVKTEHLVLFNRRTSAVADGLAGDQQESYLAASQRVAARFSASISISGAALNGFADASEGLQSAGQETFNKLIGLANDLLQKADEFFNHLFDLLNGFFNTGAQTDFEKKFNEILQGLQGLDLNNFFQGLGQLPGTAAGAQTGVQAQTFRFRFQLEFEFEFASDQAVQQSDPVTLDLNGNGIDLTSYLDGARFDITGSGQLVKTAFVTGGDAFLALDRNGNGIIDSGKELFGDQNGAANGYEELRKLDSNHDGLINAADKDFDKLLLFKDNGNGKTEAGELISLREAGIVELSLAYRNVNLRTSGGNRIAQIATYTRADGTRGTAADTILNFTV